MRSSSSPRCARSFDASAMTACLASSTLADHDGADDTNACSAAESSSDTARISTLLTEPRSFSTTGMKPSKP